MNKKMLSIYLVISILFVSTAPATAKVIYGPGTAAPIVSHLYDENGNVYYNTQTSANTYRNSIGIWTALGIAFGATIINAIVNDTQQKEAELALQ